MYFSAQEMLAQLEGTDERICDLVIKNEIELFQTSYDEIMKNLEERYQIMYNCAHDALEKEIRSLSGLTGGSALKMWNYYKKGNSICDNTVIRGAAYALSCLEVNASMGLIVAAPTAGSAVGTGRWAWWMGRGEPGGGGAVTSLHGERATNTSAASGPGQLTATIRYWTGWPPVPPGRRSSVAWGCRAEYGCLWTGQGNGRGTP